MRAAQCILLVLMLLAFGTVDPAAASAKKVVTVYQDGDVFCPRRVFVVGNVAVQAGRCYTPVVFRDRSGAFFAFMDPSVQMSRGQLVRLDTREGRRARAGIFFLVPLRVTRQVSLIPVNTIQLVRLQEEDDVDDDDDDDSDRRIKRGRLIIVIPTMPTPDVTVTIVVNF